MDRGVRWMDGYFVGGKGHQDAEISDATGPSSTGRTTKVETANSDAVLSVSRRKALTDTYERVLSEPLPSELVRLLKQLREAKK